VVPCPREGESREEREEGSSTLTRDDCLHLSHVYVQIKARVWQQLQQMRSDHLRKMNPTPYKVSLSENLYTYMHKLWQEGVPIHEIS